MKVWILTRSWVNFESGDEIEAVCVSEILAWEIMRELDSRNPPYPNFSREISEHEVLVTWDITNTKPAYSSKTYP